MAKTSLAKRLSPAVTERLAEVAHPLDAEIQALRKLILSVDLEIIEDVKWNSASYKTREFFATVNLRSLDSIQVVLHRGAKVRNDAPSSGLDIPDPQGLLEWRGNDRAIATLGTGKDFTRLKSAFTAILQAWLPFV